MRPAPHTFFYLDPPYYDFKAYRLNFEQPDFKDLAGVLKGIKGKFLMSLNDHPEVRSVFKAFNISRVPTKYSYAIGHPKRRSEVRTELLIRNY